jgi:hypothetical protein
MKRAHSNPFSHKIWLVGFLLLAALVGSTTGAWAREPASFDGAIKAAVTARTADVRRLALDLQELLPDPERAANADSARDPHLAKAFRVFHAFLMTTGKSMVAAGRTWKEGGKSGRDIVARLPAELVGTCILAEAGEPYRRDVKHLEEDLEHDRIVFHAGRLLGAWPRLVPSPV